MNRSKLFLFAATASMTISVGLPAMAYLRRIPAGSCVRTSTSGGLAITEAATARGGLYTDSLECPIGDVPNQDHGTLTTLNIDGHDGSTSSATIAQGCVTSYDGTDTQCSSAVYSSNAYGGSATLNNSHTGPFYLYVPTSTITNASYASYYAYVHLQIAGNYSRVHGVILGN